MEQKILNEILTKLISLDNKVASLDNKITSMESDINKRFDKMESDINKRFDKVESNINFLKEFAISIEENHEKRLSVLEGTVDDHSTKLNYLLSAK